MKEPQITDYKALSSLQLEELLRVELDHDDPAVALAILEELELRETAPVSCDRAWEEFCTHYLPMEAPLYGDAPPARKPVRPFSRRFAAAAAAACLACVLAVQAGGADLLRSMIRWTGTALIVESPSATESSLLPEAVDQDAAALAAASSPTPGVGEDAFVTVEPTVTECASLGDAFALIGLEHVPTAIPAGYTFTSAAVEELLTTRMLHAIYTGPEEALLQINIHCYEEGSVFSSVIPKDDAEVEPLSLRGQTFYFLTNGIYEGVVWTPDPLTECHISGPVTRDALKTLVRSMYD